MTEGQPNQADNGRVLLDSLGFDEHSTGIALSFQAAINRFYYVQRDAERTKRIGEFALRLLSLYGGGSLPEIVNNNISALTRESYQKANISLEVNDKEVVRNPNQITSEARLELEKGCPTLNNQCLLANWTALEGMIPDIGKLWLSTFPKYMRGVAFSKVEIKINHWESMSVSERAEFLVARTMNDEKSAPIRRWENMFSALELTKEGDLPKSVYDDMKEVGYTRNLIVHEGGVVNERFAKEWSRMDVYPISVRDNLNIDSDLLLEFMNCMRAYVVVVIGRVKAGLIANGIS